MDIGERRIADPWQETEEDTIGDSPLQQPFIAVFTHHRDGILWRLAWAIGRDRDKPGVRFP